MSLHIQLSVRSEDFLKIAQFFEKVAKTVAQKKIAKTFTSNLTLKVQNIYIKLLLKP
jgi:hypothetical protein